MAFRVLIAGGGTGGHLFPALAIAQELKQRGAEILFVGTKSGIEAKIVPTQGFRLEYINIAGFKRQRLIANLTLPVKVLHSFWQSFRILRSFKPQAALGTGGYVCGPVLLAAHLSGIPIFLQEQNSYPGVTTRLLARFAKKVFLNFEEAARFLPQKKNWVKVGNPVRAGFAQLDRPEAIKQWNLNPDLPTLLVFGGSQGAMSLNRAVTAILSELGKVSNLIWARGYRDNSGTERWTGSGVLIHRPFIETMSLAYAAADLAVCRSGALTLSELQAAALPAILVPFPHAAADHQKHNALAYAKQGGAVVIEDKHLTGERLWTEIRNMLLDKDRLQQMRQALAALPRQDGAKLIAQEIMPGDYHESYPA